MRYADTVQYTNIRPMTLRKLVVACHLSACGIRETPESPTVERLVSKRLRKAERPAQHLCPHISTLGSLFLHLQFFVSFVSCHTVFPEEISILLTSVLLDAPTR